MASIPPLQIRVGADTAGAEAGLSRVSAATAQVEAATTRTTARTAGFATGLRNLGNVSKVSRGRIQQVSFQLQDIAVQLQAGTRASVALSQQLPQLAGAFGAAGAALGVGLAVGIPLVAAAFSAMQTEVVDTEGALDDLREAVQDVRSYTQLALKPLEDLRLEYGLFADAVRDANSALAELAMIETADEVQAAIAAISDAFGSLDFSAIDLAFARSSEIPAAILLNSAEAIERAKVAFEALRDELSLTDATAADLLRGMQQLEAANTFEEQVAALQRMHSTLSGVEGGVEALDTPAREFLTRVLESIDALGGAAGAADGVKDAMAGAADEAGRLARNTMASINAQFAARSAVGGGRGADPRSFEDSPGTGFTFTDYSAMIDADERAASRSGRGGGGADTSDADRLREQMAARLEALRESLLTEQEALDEWRAVGLELLDEAGANELATLAEINEQKLRLEEEYQDRLGTIQQLEAQSRLQATIGGGVQILSALGQFNEKALRLSKAAAAGQAFISAYQGAAKELEKGVLGLPAAALVLAKGAAFVGAIKSVNSSGGGGGGAAAASAALAAPALPPQTVQVNFNGSEAFRNMGQELISTINQAQRDGYQLNLVGG